jgi:hypothetical protein
MTTCNKCRTEVSRSTTPMKVLFTDLSTDGCNVIWLLKTTSIQASANIYGVQDLAKLVF